MKLWLEKTSYLFLLSMVLGACSNGTSFHSDARIDTESNQGLQGSESDANVEQGDDNPEPQAIDEPIMVGGTFLFCNPIGATPSGDSRFGCDLRLKKTDKKIAVPANFKGEFKATEKDGTPVFAEGTRDQQPGYHWTVIVSAPPANVIIKAILMDQNDPLVSLELDVVLPEISEPANQNQDEIGDEAEVLAVEADVPGPELEEVSPVLSLTRAEKCAAGEAVTEVYTLDFKANRASCNWGKNGNLARTSNTIAGRNHTKLAVPLEADQRICNFSIQASKKEFFYDDIFFLALDNYILATSDQGMMSAFDSGDGYSVWNWNKIKGKPKTPLQAGDGTCLAGASSCVVPPTSSDKPLDLDFSWAELQQLPLDLDNRQGIELSVIASGDDNSNDCNHDAVSVKVTISTVKE